MAITPERIYVNGVEVLGVTVHDHERRLFVDLEYLTTRSLGRRTPHKVIVTVHAESISEAVGIVASSLANQVGVDRYSALFSVDSMPEDAVTPEPASAPAAEREGD